MMIAIESSPVGETWPLIGMLLTKTLLTRLCLRPFVRVVACKPQGVVSSSASFIRPIEGLLQDIGQSLWEMI